MLIMYTQVLLFDLGSASWRLDGWRKELWELSHIGIPDNDTNSRDAILFGFLTYWFIKEVCEECGCMCDGCGCVCGCMCDGCVCVCGCMMMCVCEECGYMCDGVCMGVCVMGVCDGCVCVCVGVCV